MCFNQHAQSLNGLTLERLVQGHTSHWQWQEEKGWDGCTVLSQQTGCARHCHPYQAQRGMPEAWCLALAIGRDSCVLISYVTASAAFPHSPSERSPEFTRYLSTSQPQATGTSDSCLSLPWHPLNSHLSQVHDNFRLCWLHRVSIHTKNSQARVLQPFYQLKQAGSLYNLIKTAAITLKLVKRSSLGS